MLTVPASPRLRPGLPLPFCPAPSWPCPCSPPFQSKLVPSTELEGVNPAKFDGVEDCAMLGYLSQPSVLHNLKLRYDAKCIYVRPPVPPLLSFHAQY